MLQQEGGIFQWLRITLLTSSSEESWGSVTSKVSFLTKRTLFISAMFPLRR